MKVPRLQRQVSAPSSTGTITQQPIDFGKDLERLADTGMETISKRNARNADALILDGENQLREHNRNYLMDAKVNRRGKDVMGSEDGSLKPLYDDYNENTETLINGMVAKVPKQYQQLAKKRYMGVANTGANSVAGYQAGQEAKWREDTKKRAVSEADSDLAWDIQNGADPVQSIDGYIERTTELFDTYGTGTDDNAKRIKLSNGVASAISFLSDENAGQAKNILNDKKYAEYISQTQREKLNTIIDNNQDVQDAEFLVSTIKASGADHQGSLEMIQSSNASDKAKALATTQLKQAKSRDDEIKNEQSNKYMMILRDEILNKGNKAGYTPLQIEADPAFDMLTRTHKNIVKSWVNGTADGLKAGQFEDKDRLLRFDSMIRAIDTNQMTMGDLLKLAGEEYDIRDGTKLHSYFSNHSNDMVKPEKYADEYLNGKYPGIDNDDKLAVKMSVYDDIQKFRENNQGASPPNDIVEGYVKDNAKAPVEVSLYERATKSLLKGPMVVDKGNDIQRRIQLINEYPKLGKSQAELFATGEKVPEATRNAMRYRQQGWKNAYPVISDPQVYMFLGEPPTPDGYIYYVTGGMTKGVPKGSPEAKKLIEKVRKGLEGKEGLDNEQ